MSSSYKERIASRLTLVTSLIILVVFGVIYFVANLTVINTIDRELGLETDKHKGQIFLVNGEIRFLHMDEWEEMEHSQIQLNPIFIEIVDLNGKSMDRSPNLRENHLSFSPEKSAKKEAWTLRLGASEVRQMQIPLITAGKQEGYLLVAKSFDDSRELLNNLRNVLLILYPGILLSLFLTMRYLAGKSIEPIQQIIRKTNQITQSNLNERVPLAEANDEIGQLTRSINELLERLEASLNREKQFTSDASHELRTPLSVLRGTLEVLIRKPRTAEEYVEKIKTSLSSIDRMSATIDQLLALAREEKGKNLVKEELELITFLEEIVDETASEQNRKITFQSQSGIPIYLKANEKSLQLILGNLLQNAIKYSKPETEIFVKTGLNVGTPYIEICDSGSGISKEYLEKIFDPFFREKEAVDQLVPGTGLGLAIVKKLAQESGIKVSVSSEKGKGSTFRLDFPNS
ncbi:MAG: HAMP domain-containing sensor histidine kinase [Algoriphagus sp.]|uniref:sensor histidine kinase n=1 Tax=Algoriphagus sp. TaxID=1872435 RepID=UPI00273175CA|nr:HAMP domain-containing sensor histidine kinase [Algoriphagus sp.]MDP2043271.1 HAMP domain-containing sensor histidine kinase [Algoriphagus sp.]MDP3472715.1 HAMP domain-containing sensor histidine kinase [Algoriphagus sp.]